MFIWKGYGGVSDVGRGKGEGAVRGESQYKLFYNKVMKGGGGRTMGRTYFEKGGGGTLI